jgi:hypothetical protein
MPQFDFSNLPVTLHPAVQQVLNDTFQNISDNAFKFEVLMSFPESLETRRKVFLLHVRSIDAQQFFIDAMYCINESDSERHVWAYATRSHDTGSALQLKHCDKPLDLIGLIEHWQQAVLDDIAKNDVMFAVRDMPFWQQYQFVENIAG